MIYRKIRIQKGGSRSVRRIAVLAFVLLSPSMAALADSTLPPPRPGDGITRIHEHDPKRNPFKGRPVDRLDLSCYQLTYSDEFNDSPLSAARGLGEARYRTRYYWGDDVINNELEYYADPKLHKVDVLPVRNGKLLITARKLRTPIRSSKGKLFHYASGLITTQGRFSQTYGLFEIRAKLPKGKGLWPAFWLLPENAKKWHERGYSRMPEIDIMEQLGSDMHTWYATMHTKTPPYTGGWTAGNWRIYGTDIHTKADLSQGFHTYAIDWQPDELVWYFDGVPVKHEPAPRDFRNDPRYLIINLAVGGNWPGKPDAKTKFPAEFAVDYVRVYAKKKQCASGRPAPAGPLLMEVKAQ